MWVVINLLAAKNHKSCRVDDDGYILQTVDGNNGQIRVVFHEEEGLLNNIFGKLQMPPEPLSD